MTTSQINDVIGRMGKNIRAARVARACGILSRTLRLQSKQKMWNYVVKPRVFCLFLRQSYNNPFCAARTRRTKRKISLLAQSFDIANTISVGNLMLSMSMLDFPQERLSNALFLERR